MASAQLPDGSLLQVGMSTEDRDELLEAFGWIVLGILIPVVGGGVIGGMFLAFRALRPVRHLIETVRAIEAGTLGARVPTRQTGDELDELGRLFNTMLEKIAALILGMRRALDSVAHDLRTPMTRVRGIAELALTADADLATCREALADCVEEADRVRTLLDTLMDISEAETGTMTLQIWTWFISRRSWRMPSISTATWPPRRTSASRRAPRRSSASVPTAIGCGRSWPISWITPSSIRPRVAPSPWGPPSTGTRSSSWSRIPGWASPPKTSLTSGTCGLRCHQCGPDAHDRINDGWPGECSIASRAFNECEPQQVG